MQIFKKRLGDVLQFIYKTNDMYPGYINNSENSTVKNKQTNKNDAIRK